MKTYFLVPIICILATLVGLPNARVENFQDVNRVKPSETFDSTQTQKLLVVFQNRFGEEYYGNIHISFIDNVKVIAFEDTMTHPVGKYTIVAIHGNQSLIGKSLFLYYRP